jgi:hypothetical protein
MDRRLFRLGKKKQGQEVPPKRHLQRIHRRKEWHDLIMNSSFIHYTIIMIKAKHGA